MKMCILQMKMRVLLKSSCFCKVNKVMPPSNKNTGKEKKKKRCHSVTKIVPYGDVEQPAKPRRKKKTPPKKSSQRHIRLTPCRRSTPGTDQIGHRAQHRVMSLQFRSTRTSRTCCTSCPTEIIRYRRSRPKSRSHQLHSRYR